VIGHFMTDLARQTLGRQRFAINTLSLQIVDTILAGKVASQSVISSSIVSHAKSRFRWSRTPSSSLANGNGMKTRARLRPARRRETPEVSRSWKSIPAITTNESKAHVRETTADNEDSCMIDTLLSRKPQCVHFSDGFPRRTSAEKATN
jgi:hypothetical protein